MQNSKSQSSKTMVEIKKQIEDKGYKRYVLSVVSWQEELVVENLKQRVKKQNLENDVIDFMSPMINESSMKKWEKIIKQKKLYPWYVLVKSKMNDKIRYVVRNTPWVRLIVWAETKPVPISDEELNRIIEQVEKSKERSEMKVPFKEWDVVSLKSWDFKWMKWVIRKIDWDKWTIIVNIEMLGRLTPVVIDADKVSLIS